MAKSTSYGRFGFSIAQPGGGCGPYTLSMVDTSNSTTVRIELTEEQGLLLLADLAEFCATVLRQVVEAKVYAQVK